MDSGQQMFHILVDPPEWLFIPWALLMSSALTGLYWLINAPEKSQGFGIKQFDRVVGLLLALAVAVAVGWVNSVPAACVVWVTLDMVNLVITVLKQWPPGSTKH